MKIAIDISPIVYGTGVSTYSRNLVTNLLKIDMENEYILFGGSLRRRSDLRIFIDTIKKYSPQDKIFPIPPTFADILWNKLHILPIEKLVGGIDVFHSSDWTQPPSNAFKVTTIHDLVPIKFPKLTDSKIVSVHSARMKWIKKEVDRVIVPSETTANDAVRFGISKEKVRVIPEAVDPNLKPAKFIEIERLKRKYRIKGKYLLAVGVNPRKNTDRIIEAFERIKPEIDLKLVVIGHKFHEFGVKRGVIFTDHIPDEDLPLFYSGATVLVYPSLYEGFGIPILEAFTCKTPVVTSNFGSMAEVAEKAAILIDPYDVNSIVEGILKAIKNRDKLVKLGINRIKNFSWEKTAKETLKVYEEST